MIAFIEKWAKVVWVWAAKRRLRQLEGEKGALPDKTIAEYRRRLRAAGCPPDEIERRCRSFRFEIEH